MENENMSNNESRVVDWDAVALRKPLAPTSDDVDCKAEHDGLLREYSELSQIRLNRGAIAEGHSVAVEDYVRRACEYADRRDAYNRKFASKIETIEMVRKNIVEIQAQIDSAPGLDAGEILFGKLCDEQSKFKEIQDAADEAFVKVAKKACSGGASTDDGK